MANVLLYIIKPIILYFKKSNLFRVALTIFLPRTEYEYCTVVARHVRVRMTHLKN